MKFASQFNPETRVWSGLKVPYAVPADVHISEIVLDGLKRTPDRVVQINYDDESAMTCNELRLKMIRFAQNMKLIGIKEDDVVGVICSNSSNLMAYVNGIIQLGAILNPMFIGHSSSDLVNMFKQTEPKLVICDAEIYDKVSEAMNELQSDAPIYTSVSRIDGVPFIDDFLLKTGREDEYQTQKFNDPSLKTLCILTSSGTTGPAKGVCMSQTYFLKLVDLVPSDVTRSLNVSPIFWGSAFSSLILSTIIPETRIITRQDFTPERFLTIATKYKATTLLLNPPKLTLLLQSPFLKSFDKSNVRTVIALGGIVSEQIRKRFSEEFPNVFFQIFYSLTETSVSTVFPAYPGEGLTVGFVLPNHEVKITDEDGSALNVGEVGEICARFTVCPFMVKENF